MKRINKEKTIERIKELSELNGISPAQIAREFNIAHQCVYEWFRGKRMPSLNRLIGISDMFGVTLDDLVVIEEVTENE